MMEKIEIYSKDWCPYCSKAKSLLQSKQLDYTEVDITSDQTREQEMIERPGRRTVPQIFIGGEFIGGATDVLEKHQTGELQTRLRQAHVEFDQSARIESSEMLPTWLHPR